MESEEYSEDIEEEIEEEEVLDLLEEPSSRRNVESVGISSSMGMDPSVDS